MEIMTASIFFPQTEKVRGLVQAAKTAVFGRSLIQQKTISNSASVNFFASDYIINKTREEVLKELEEKAIKMKCHKIIDLRFEMVQFNNNQIQILAYGTGVGK